MMTAIDPEGVSVIASARMSDTLYVIAGEMSGDAHAAGLLRELRTLRPGLEIRGVGGPKMQEVAGEGIRDWLDQAAVMGIVEVLKHYKWFKARFYEMLEEIKLMKPKVLLLVDYPGFNFRFAAAVRKELPETKIVQYVCPQVWAWKKGRIPKMVELFDEVLCLLPFEEKIFEDTKLKTNFVGHPLVDELEEERIEDAERDPNLIALMLVFMAAAISLSFWPASTRAFSVFALSSFQTLLGTGARGAGGPPMTLSQNETTEGSSPCCSRTRRRKAFRSRFVHGCTITFSMAPAPCA